MTEKPKHSFRHGWIQVSLGTGFLYVLVLLFSVLIAFLSNISHPLARCQLWGDIFQLSNLRESKMDLIL